MKKILIKFSGVFFVVIITVILFLLYYLWGPSLGWMEPAEKFRVLCTIFAVPVFLSLLLVSRYSLVAFASRLRFFHKLNDKQNTWSNNSAHLKQVDISKKIINDVQQVLRHTYGHFWHSKVRILLMTGSVSDVEQLAPKLTRELWQEDRGTVLLWGGDPATPADADWLAVLRKLRRRAVDGMVWVTSALDVLPATENSATSGLTPDAMDSVSHALKLRYEALGWKLPLYVWSLHPRAGEQAGRVTQPVGCLLPANCSPQTLAGQLTGLIPQLTAQGIQQVCGQPQHNFLLALADQLTRKPETVTEPLSVLLNPYRPQPLAGVVFKRSFSAEKNRQFPGDISAKLRPLGLNYYVTCPGSPLDAERSAKSRLKQWALSTRCYPQDFEARLTRVRKKPRILFLTRLWDPEEPAVQQYPDLQAEWRQVNADRIELLHRLQSAFPAQFTGGVSDNTCARRQCPELIVPDMLTGKRAYLHRMQHTEICVASTGLHGSTGWKLAEYVAAGRAIVTEPLRYTLPGGFEEGKNYKTYTSPAQCEEQLRQLLADPAAILAMAQHNADYYQMWLRPEQQVRQALRQLETGEL